MSSVMTPREPVRPTSSREDSQSERLSDDEIQQLLLEAETRLRTIHVAGIASGSLGSEAVSKQKGGRKPLPKLGYGMKAALYIKEKDGIARVDSARLLDNEQRKLADTQRSTGPCLESKNPNDNLSAGADWFELPKTVLTPQLKRDLQLLEMRSVLDPHRHWKKDNRKAKVPTFSHVGTVIEGSTEWYSSRINKKDRAKNFVEENIAAENENGRLKRKYDDLQAAKMSGKKAHYKGLMVKRKRKV